MKPDLPPTVSRATLLVNGRDEVFRALITDFLAFGDALRNAREEIAAALGVSASSLAGIRAACFRTKVRKCQLELAIKDTIHLLNAGDSFHFPSDLPHEYRNLGKKRMRAVWIKTPPSF